jgi:hypothetical protein
VVLTAGEIPTSGKTSDPDRARFYVAPSLTGSYFRQPDVAANANSITFTASPTFTGTTGPNATPFPGLTPAKITSSNGLLELSAGGTAIFGSIEDASTASGNKPALRIGDIAGTHMRIDGNEIVAMTNDNTQGNLFLNLGGGTRVGAGDFIKGIGAGQGTFTTNTSGDITVTHGAGVTPKGVIPVAGTGHKMWMTAVTATTATFRCYNIATGAVLGSGVSVQVYWVAIGV